MAEMKVDGMVASMAAQKEYWKVDQMVDQMADY